MVCLMCGFFLTQSLMHIRDWDSAEAIKNDIPQFGFWPLFGGRVGGMASSAVVHVTGATTVFFAR